MPKRTVAEMEALLAAERARTAALEREHAATAEILRAVGESPDDLPRVLGIIADRAARLTGCETVSVWRRAADDLKIVALRGADGAIRFGGDAIPLARGSVLGRAVLEARTVHAPDMAILSEEEYPLSAAIYRERGHRTVLAVPMVHAGRAVGGIVAFRTEWRPFAPPQVALLVSFADQAAIAIENARLVGELRERLQEQTATAEVLRSIAESPMDPQRVLDAIAGSALRLTRSDMTAIHAVDGENLRVVARARSRPPPPEQSDPSMPLHPFRAGILRDRG